MTAKGSTRAMLVLPVLLAGLGALLAAAAKPEAAQDWGAGLELLGNGNFDGPLGEQGPTGWFQAMAPAQTDGLRAGLEQVLHRGNVAFIEQTGVKTKVANNWAQRVSTIPLGATVQVAADVKTQNVPADTGFVMVQFWNEAARLIGGASSQTVEPIGGTQDWKRISFEFIVPPGTEAMILRCGLAESGKIWFDNITMKVVAAGVGPAGDPGKSVPTPYSAVGTVNRGFEVTPESLRQLQQVQKVGADLVACAQRELGTDVRVRQEVFAQGNGQFRVVLLLDLSKPQ